MDPPDALRLYLNTLTTYLDMPGTDLSAILDVLIDDIAGAVPSFLGLRLTVTAGGGRTTIATAHRHPTTTAKASLLLPLEHLSPEAAPGDGMVLFAASPGAFAALAHATRRTFGLDGQIQVDEHLPDACGAVIETDAGITDDDLRVINVAIGVLIDRGYPPERARGELGRRAGLRGTLAGAARDLLDSL